MEKYYRVRVGDKGLYEVLDEIDPDKEKRKKGPSDNWYPHVPSDKYPECNFWWTEKGFKEYTKRGVLDFHKNILPKSPMIQTAINPKNIRYKDNFQIAVNDKDIEILEN